MPSSAPALAVEEIRASYGPLQVLFDTSLWVGHGEMVALMGPNGVGKSTLLKVIGGLLRPDAGTVRISGVDMTTASSTASGSRRGCARSSDRPRSGR